MAPGEHPTVLDKKKLKKVALHHLSWSQIHTEAVVERVNRSVTDPDQAWILSELIRYLEHPRSGAVDFDDMGSSWVAVRDGVTHRSILAKDRGVADVVDRFGQLVIFSAMRLSRNLGVNVRPVLTKADQADAGVRMQKAATISSNRASCEDRCSYRTDGPIEVEQLTSARVQITCSVSIPSPGQAKATTRVNWLARQLPKAPGSVLLEAWNLGGRSRPDHAGRWRMSVPTHGCSSKIRRRRSAPSTVHLAARRRHEARSRAGWRSSARSWRWSNGSMPRSYSI